MTSQKELYAKYESDLKELQSKCTHIEISDWLTEYWAPGHSTDRKVKVCMCCGFIVDATKSNFFEIL